MLVERCSMECLSTSLDRMQRWQLRQRNQSFLFLGSSMSSLTLYLILLEGSMYLPQLVCGPLGISQMIDFSISWLGSLQRFGFWLLIKQQMELIGHGAEARVFRLTKETSITVLKERLPKKYRHPELDKKLNQSRLRSEVKVMKKLLGKGVRVPKLVNVDEEKYSIEMEFIRGRKLKDYINDPLLTPQKIQEVLQRMGRIIGKVHEVGIIHGDLTTSNMIMTEENDIVLLDFGLSYFKDSAEDRAVDLYVLERAFKSTHPALEEKFNALLIAYGNEAALKKLEVVRQRGRKKVAFG